MIQELLNIGLSPYEAACYVCLLKNGSQKGKAVADLAKIPRTSVYPNLEELEKKGFVTLISKEPKTYRAKDPAIAISSYTHVRNDELKSKAETAIEASKNIHSIIPIAEEMVELLVGKSQSYPAAKKLGYETKKELLIIGSGKTTSLLSAIHDWIRLAKSGIILRMIFNQEPDRNLVNSLIKANIEVRVGGVPNLSLIVSDRKIVHYSIRSDKLSGGRICVRVVNEDFAKAQYEFFEMIWKKAKK